jgi:hypothetical protein
MVSSLSIIVRNWRTLLFFAVGMLFAPSRANADCGDYVTILKHGKDSHQGQAILDFESPSQYEFNQTTPIKAPCHGPNCSGVPGRKFPPLAPVTQVNVRLKELTHSVILSDPYATPGFMLARDCSSPDPIDQVSSIFHPPRLF